MKRLAAHRIVISEKESYSLHYVELGDQNHLSGIYPLTQEPANTSFYNGTILLSNYAEWEEITDWENHSVDKGKPVYAFHLDSCEFTPTELRTSNRCGNCHIQRLC